MQPASCFIFILHNIHPRLQDDPLAAKPMVCKIESVLVVSYCTHKERRAADACFTSGVAYTLKAYTQVPVPRQLLCTCSSWTKRRGKIGECERSQVKEGPGELGQHVRMHAAGEPKAGLSRSLLLLLCLPFLLLPLLLLCSCPLLLLLLLSPRLRCKANGKTSITLCSAARVAVNLSEDLRLARCSWEQDNLRTQAWQLPHPPKRAHSRSPGASSFASSAASREDTNSTAMLLQVHGEHRHM